MTTTFKVASGTLLKQSSSGLFWNQRYFVLTPRELYYHDSGAFAFTAPATSHTQTARGTAELAGARVTNTKSTRSGKFAFKLVHRKGKWVLSGATLAETLEWVAALQSVGVASTFDASYVEKNGGYAEPGRSSVRHSIQAPSDRDETDGGDDAFEVPPQADLAAQAGLQSRPALSAVPMDVLDSLGQHAALFGAAAWSTLAEPRLLRDKAAVVARLLRSLLRVESWRPDAWVRVQSEGEVEAAANAVRGALGRRQQPPQPQQQQQQQQQQQVAAAAGPSVQFAYSFLAGSALWVGWLRALLQMVAPAPGGGDALSALLVSLCGSALLCFLPFWCLLGVPTVASRSWPASPPRALLTSIGASLFATSLDLGLCSEATTRVVGAVLAPRSLLVAVPFVLVYALQACLYLSCALLVARHGYVQTVLYTEATLGDDDACAVDYTAYEDDAEVRSVVAARKAARNTEAVQAAMGRHEARKAAGVGAGVRELV